MAATGDSKLPLLAAGAVGFGVGALVAATMSRPVDPQSSFSARLRERLAARSVGLVAATFGRLNGMPTWVLTLELPNQHVMAVHAPVEAGQDPFAREVSDDIAVRVFQHLL